ncbi:MAG: TspO/MBR family protein [Desulfocapsaceae bacterium]|nr:TspO/MBR family protein [Desulfocapsaceae bacterium]
MKSHPISSFLVLSGTSIVSFTLLILGGWLTFLGLGDWYYELNFPPFQPPAWVFTPAWIIVLTCLALSTWLVIRRLHDYPGFVAFGLMIYGARCVFNAVWSLLFFTVQRPDLALWEILIFDVFLVIMVWAYAKVSKLAAILLAPYLVWLSLSTAINIYIVQHNNFPI